MRICAFMGLLLIAASPVGAKAVCDAAFASLSKGFENLDTQVGQRAQQAGPFEVTVAGITRTVTKEQVDKARSLINEIRENMLKDNNIASAFERFLDIPIEKFVLLHQLDPAASQELASFMRAQIISALIQQGENPDQNIFPERLISAYQLRFAGISAALRDNFKEHEFDPHSQEHVNFRQGRGQYEGRDRGQYIWEFYAIPWSSLLEQIRNHVAATQRREQDATDRLLDVFEGGGDISVDFLAEPLKQVYEALEGLARQTELNDAARDEFITLLESPAHTKLFEALDQNYKDTDADEHALFEVTMNIVSIVGGNTWSNEQKERILNALALLHNAVPDDGLLAAAVHLSRTGRGE